VKRMWDISKERWIKSISTKQMSPNSDFLKGLNAKKCRDDIDYVAIAGTSSIFTNVYAWRWSKKSWRRKVGEAREKNQKRIELQSQEESPLEWYHLPEHPYLHAFNWILEPEKILQIYPKIGYKEVLQGDGAVSVDSALLEQEGVKHYLLPNNHIEITCTQEGKMLMLREIFNTLMKDK
ncbi:MAG: hypothetical protein U9O98_08405, partial [Asgard group archaeon]|nr:hypothetical protein [Asgard group archaeon]